MATDHWEPHPRSTPFICRKNEFPFSVDRLPIFISTFRLRSALNIEVTGQLLFSVS